MEKKNCFRALIGIVVVIFLLTLIVQAVHYSSIIAPISTNEQKEAIYLSTMALSGIVSEHDSYSVFVSKNGRYYSKDRIIDVWYTFLDHQIRVSVNIDKRQIHSITTHAND